MNGNAPSGCGSRLPGMTLRTRLFDRGFHPHLTPEPKRLRYVGPTSGIGWRNERIIPLQLESVAIFAGCKLMCCLQMSFERFEFFTANETRNGLWCDGPSYSDSWLPTFRITPRDWRRFRDACEGFFYAFDDGWQISGCHGIVRQI